MARVVSWRVSRPICECRNGTTQVSETDVHGDTDTTLGRTANVVSVPGDTHGNVGVDTGGSQEGTKVLNMGVVSGDQHGEANDREKTEKDHEDSTLALLVSEVASGDGRGTSKDVRRDGHEL